MSFNRNFIFNFLTKILLTFKFYLFTHDFEKDGEMENTESKPNVQKAQTKQDKRKIISSRSQVISKDKRDLNDYKDAVDSGEEISDPSSAAGTESSSQFPSKRTWSRWIQSFWKILWRQAWKKLLNKMRSSQLWLAMVTLSFQLVNKQRHATELLMKRTIFILLAVLLSYRSLCWMPCKDWPPDDKVDYKLTGIMAKDFDKVGLFQDFLLAPSSTKIFDTKWRMDFDNMIFPHRLITLYPVSRNEPALHNSVNKSKRQASGQSSNQRSSVPACSQGAVGSTIVQDAAEPNTAEEPETNFARAQQPEEISDDEDFLETRVVGSPEDQPSENLLDTPEEGQSLLQDLQADGGPITLVDPEGEADLSELGIIPTN